MPSLTIQLVEATYQLVEKHAAEEAKEPSSFVAAMVAHQVEQAAEWEAIRKRIAETPRSDSIKELLAAAPSVPPLPGDELPEIEEMKCVSSALTFAMAFLGSVDRESDSDADSDTKALEEITSQIANVTSQERLALLFAAQKARATQLCTKSPNHSLISGYDDVLEHLEQLQNEPQTFS